VNQGFEKVRRHLQNEIARGTFPSAQFLIGEGGQIVSADALGYAVITPDPIPATEDTLYDLASLTKPLVTTLLATIFAERGILDFNAPASRYLEELRDTDKREITLTQLLTHSSGLIAWRPLYLEARSRADVVAAIAQTELNPAPSAPVVYSDLNFILLGFILERALGARLDALAGQEIFAPLGLRRTMFNPPAELKWRIAATELGQTHERATVANLKFVCPLRDKAAVEPTRQPLRRKNLIWGEVHDGNAYFMDGVSGHAGLFSTAAEVFVLANQFLPCGSLLSRASLSIFQTNYTAGRGDDRSIGWMLASTRDCSAGPALPPHAFGHNGFTGTSVWIDPERARVLVLLTNRVHPAARDLGIKAARQQFNSLAVEALNHAVKAS
jgi:CubicO group peptidase (beta-lactamase class C family)